MVAEVVGVEDYFLGYRAIACPCLCRSVESSLCVFTMIGCDGCVRGVIRFCWRFRSGESDGRSWRSLMIFEGVVGAGGFRRLDLMLRSSPKRGQSRILVSQGYRVRVSHVSVNPSCRVSKWTDS